MHLRIPICLHFFTRSKGGLNYPLALPMFCSFDSDMTVRFNGRCTASLYLAQLFFWSRRRRGSARLSSFVLMSCHYVVIAAIVGAAVTG